MILHEIRPYSSFIIKHVIHRINKQKWSNTVKNTVKKARRDTKQQSRPSYKKAGKMRNSSKSFVIYEIDEGIQPVHLRWKMKNK